MMKQLSTLAILALLAGFFMATPHLAYGNGISTRDIDTLTYNQNFDGVTAPAMPAGWQVMVNPAGSDAIVNTDNSDAHSAPNSVRFHGGYNGGATLYLIAPLLADSIAVQSVRMRLWLKAISAYQLQVGVMDDSANPASFTLISTISFNGNWQEYLQSLASYTGTGRYIALRAENLSIGGSLLLDDFRLERIWPVDLAALTLDTDTTQSLQVGHPSNFEITVQNLGANLQDIYYVVLCNAINDMQLATANGYNLQPGQTWNVDLTWTPVEAGSFTLYAKVVLTGDGDLSNNHSPNLTIEVTRRDRKASQSVPATNWPGYRWISTGTTPCMKTSIMPQSCKAAVDLSPGSTFTTTSPAPTSTINPPASGWATPTRATSARAG
jgi:hypothetical protein